MDLLFITNNVYRNRGKWIIDVSQKWFTTGHRTKVRTHEFKGYTHLDSDGQHDPSFIPSLVDPIKKEEFDLVIGSRFKSKSGRKKVPNYRMVGIQTITQVFNHGTTMDLTDSQSGFRAYSKRALDIIKVTSDNMDASMEILFDAKDGGLKIKEIPIMVEYDGLEGSSEDPVGHGVRVLANTVRLIRERYPLRFFGTIGSFLIFLIPFVMLYSRMMLPPKTGFLPPGGYFVVTFLGIMGSFLIFTGVMHRGVNRISVKLMKMIKE
ncbi:MAG: glycosyltransferase family 2 protein [Candidatus Thermoplasmatota archaeon]|nr:glycosyltransferase family 2 protein [Candidatus Thermoplasmatota archaeon]